GKHATAGQVKGQVKTFPTKSKVEAEVERRGFVLPVTDGALVQMVDHPVAVLIHVFDIAGTQGSISLPVVVNFPVGDLFPAAELSGRLQAPVQVPVAFHNGVPVLVPGVAETRLVLMPVIKPRVRDVTPDGISQLAGPVVPYNGCVVTLVGKIGRAHV